jgi:methionyl-tRNA synthetase|tara:strand:- start:3917 stop:5215 length:1299 start_codon:yes stop_codon:yes gene_type:complete
MFAKLPPAGARLAAVGLISSRGRVAHAKQRASVVSSQTRRPVVAARATTRRDTHVASAAVHLGTPTSEREKCFVTTPIYYVNDRPHIGHVYTSTVADVYARFQRGLGKDVFFLTGTDEHGLKVEQSAAAKGVAPQVLADENSEQFRRVMSSMNISFDGFIRTTDASHVHQVRKFVELLKEKEMVYLGEFVGWYDEGQEEYYTETKAKELEYKSPISGKDMVKSSEENYYFKLSAFQERLEALHEQNPEFLTPAPRRNEMIERLKTGLNDVPISRTNFTWGVSMPGDEKHVVYVWIDALLNYITALGLGETDGEGTAGSENDTAAVRRQAGELKKYWPASVHVMAKEISWFHAVIWPALLMALEMPLPERVHAHGFWIRDGKKMSKSLGNFVDLEVIDRFTTHYGLDGFRYFLLVEGTALGLSQIPILFYPSW